MVKFRIRKKVSYMDRNRGSSDGCWQLLRRSRASVGVRAKKKTTLFGVVLNL
jgi:hypothetical protein